MAGLLLEEEEVSLEEFHKNPPKYCKACLEEGIPGPSEDRIFGDGEEWARGTIPAILRHPPAPSGPLWGSKLGSPPHPGASVHRGPTDLSQGPFFWLEDVRDAGRSYSANLLIDARSRVILPCRNFICAFGFEGRRHWLVRFPQIVASTPAIVGNLLYVAEMDGSLCCVDIGPDTPVILWEKQFCAACLGDPSAIAANKELVVSGGMEEKPPEGFSLFMSSHIFGVDAKSGDRRWSVKLSTSTLMLVPSIAGDAVFYMASSGAVECVGVKDGKHRWLVKGELGAMSTGGAIVDGGRVFVACNRKAKRSFNAPFGGKGAVRAYGQKDGALLWEQPFDLEANTVPAFCPKPAAVIVLLGASPGPPNGTDKDDRPLKPTGDSWPGRVVALKPESGEVLWSYELPEWKATASAGNVSFGPAKGIMAQPCPGFASPVVDADGVIYVGWNAGGWLCALNGSDGNPVSWYAFHHPIGCMVVAPGTLWVYMHLVGFGMFTRGRPAPQTLLRPLELTFDESGSGTEHFWPNKSNDPRCLGRSKWKGPRDLSRPAWVFKTPLKIVDDWYGNSAVMDAQRNMYLSGNFSDVFVVRPDGSLRGSVYAGPYASTPSLYEDCLFVTDCQGWARCFKLDTLELKWAKRYCDYTCSDNYSLLAFEGRLIVPGQEALSAEVAAHFGHYGCGRTQFSSGHRYMWCLDCQTGETMWKANVPMSDPMWVLWNFTPVIFQEFMVVMDYMLGVYCYHWADGTLVWFHEPPADGIFSTGNQCCGANGLTYLTGNHFCEPVMNSTNGRGVVCAYDIRTGEKRFEIDTKDHRGKWIASHQGPILVPGDRIVAVPFSTNLGGNPMETTAGDAFSGKLLGLDAETGEEVWSVEWPLYRHCHVIGSFLEDPGLVWPDSWGGMSVDSAGTIYCHWMDGMVYAVEGQTGTVLSKYDTGNSSNAQAVLAPGMVIFVGCFGAFCFRDEQIEREWLAEAQAKGDPRAKAPLLDVPPTADEPLRPPADRWRGPAYAEEQNICEGRVWIEAWSKAHAAYQAESLEWSLPQGTGAAAATAPGASASGVAPAKGALWLVVGGSDKGIVVRKGKKLASAELPRLQKGARLEQLELDGDRLHYQKVEGEGPDTGWVSLTFKGAKLVEPA